MVSQNPIGVNQAFTDVFVLLCLTFDPDDIGSSQCHCHLTSNLFFSYLTTSVAVIELLLLPLV